MGHAHAQTIRTMCLVVLTLSIVNCSSPMIRTTVNVSFGRIMTSTAMMGVGVRVVAVPVISAIHNARPILIAQLVISVNHKPVIWMSKILAIPVSQRNNVAPVVVVWIQHPECKNVCAQRRTIAALTDTAIDRPVNVPVPGGCFNHAILSFSVQMTNVQGR